MKTIVRAAAVAASLALSMTASTAFAADLSPGPSTEHFDRRAPVRVWVVEGKMTAADCNGPTMQGSDAAGCMSMPSTGNRARQG